MGSVPDIPAADMIVQNANAMMVEIKDFVMTFKLYIYYLLFD